MRHLLSLGLLFSCLTTYGQGKTFIGTYTDTLVTHKRFFTIQDGGHFKTEEFMDEGKRNLLGTWTFQKDTLRFKTTKIFAWDKKTPNQKKEFTPKDFSDMLGTVDKDGILTIVPLRAKMGEDEYYVTRLRKVKK